LSIDGLQEGLGHHRAFLHCVLGPPDGYESTIGD
jgi:hypothetical protein